MYRLFSRLLPVLIPAVLLPAPRVQAQNQELPPRSRVDFVPGYGRSENLRRVTSPLGPIRQFAGTADHEVILYENGSVQCRGQNNAGQCDIPPLPGRVKVVAAGQTTSFALLEGGRLLAWGACPQFDPAMKCRAVSAAGKRSGVILEDGRVWLFDMSGLPPESAKSRHITPQLPFPAVSLSAGSDTTILGPEGQLAVISINQAFYESGDYQKFRIRLIEGKFKDAASCGDGGSFVALRTDGTLEWHQWNESAPRIIADNVLAIPATDNFYMGYFLRSDGILCRWDVRRNQNNEHITTIIPVSRKKLPVKSWTASANLVLADGSLFGETPDFRAERLRLTKIAGTPGRGPCLAIDENRRLHRLALRDEPLDLSAVPYDFPPVTGISICGNFVVCLLEDGTVRAWGENHDGQCEVPPGLSGVAEIAAGVSFAAARKKSGEIVVWGNLELSAYDQRNLAEGGFDSIKGAGYKVLWASRIGENVSRFPSEDERFRRDADSRGASYPSLPEDTNSIYDMGTGGTALTREGWLRSWGVYRESGEPWMISPLLPRVTAFADEPLRCAALHDGRVVFLEGAGMLPPVELGKVTQLLSSDEILLGLTPEGSLVSCRLGYYRSSWSIPVGWFEVGNIRTPPP